MAFLDMGDQFLALADGCTQPPDRQRRFGLVVDDRPAVRRLLEAMGLETLPGSGLDFVDPWGNRVRIVGYRDVQFLKAPPVLEAMGLGGLGKSERARRELADKGIHRQG